jgi:hypothetical protein
MVDYLTIYGLKINLLAEIGERLGSNTLSKDGFLARFSIS